jgi:hypothetical protein
MKPNRRSFLTAIIAPFLIKPAAKLYPGLSPAMRRLLLGVNTYWPPEFPRPIILKSRQVGVTQAMHALLLNKHGYLSVESTLKAITQ